MNELIYEPRPTLLECMSAAVDAFNKRRRNPSNGDERVRALEDAQGNAGPRTIPYKKPLVDNSEQLSSDSAERKPLLVQTTGTRGDPRQRPGKRNKLGKVWTEGDILTVIFGKAVDFNSTLHGQALQRAYGLRTKLRLASKMLQLREAISP